MDDRKWPEGRRSQIQIIAEILSLLRLSEVGKTEIMYTVNMSYFQVQRYLNLMLELGLVDTHENEHHMVFYQITKKGLEILNRIETILEMLQRKENPHILNSPQVMGGAKHNGRTLTKQTAT